MEKKVCTKCKIEKSLTEYYKDKNTKDGFRSDCKECNCASRKKWREENPEKVKAIWKKYREENKEQIKARDKKYREENAEQLKAYIKKYREENKEQIRAQRKKYREENKEKVKARDKKYYEENKEQIKAYGKKYYQENKEQVKATKKKYRKANPGKVRASERIKNFKRRAQKLNTQVEVITDELLNEHWNKKGIDPQRCYHCDKTFEGVYEHLDHYYPLSRGGTHTKENLVPSCASCNSSKGNKTPEEWKEFQAL